MEKFKSSAIFEDAEISTIDGLRVDYDDGWGLLRASNTTSCLVMRFEAESEERLLEIKNSFISQIRKIDSRLEIPNE
jgi:phosphomannomutase